MLPGLYVKSPQGFGFIVMFPLAFGSNVFIQASTLPGGLQAWVGVNPVTALAGASRGPMPLIVDRYLRNAGSRIRKRGAILPPDHGGGDQALTRQAR